MGNSGSTEESVLPEVKNRCNDLVRHARAKNVTMTIKLLQETIDMIRERKHVYMEAFLDVLTGKASSSEEDNNILLKIMNKRVKKKRHRIKIEKTNRFTYKGNINDYELFKKTPTKNFLKKDICFKNFKSL